MTGGLSWLFQASQPLRGFSAQVLALLLEATLKGTILLLLAAASTLALRRASAATRHTVWTLALAALLVLPIASLTVPAWKVPMISPPPADTAGERTKISEDFAVATPDIKSMQTTQRRGELQRLSRQQPTRLGWDGYCFYG